MIHAAWGWGLVVLGSALIGVGGTVATLGWNNLRAREQWRSAIKGIVNEIQYNGGVIAREQSGGEGKYKGLEKLHHSHVMAAIVSGVVDKSSQQSRKVAETLDDYRRGIDTFNSQLSSVANNRDYERLLIDNPGHSAPGYSTPPIPAPFKVLQKIQLDTITTMQEAYPWAF